MHCLRHPKFNRSGKMTKTKTNPISSLALALVASAAMLGFAASPAEARSVRVEVSKYELGTPAGRKAAEARVAAVADAVCARGGVDWRNLGEASAHKRCVADAMANARIQISALSARTQMASR
jgi:UrcA family protein